VVGVLSDCVVSQGEGGGLVEDDELCLAVWEHCLDDRDGHVNGFWSSATGGVAEELPYMMRSAEGIKGHLVCIWCALEGRFF
jgi:hypothetical protein